MKGGILEDQQKITYILSWGLGMLSDVSSGGTPGGVVGQDEEEDDH